MEDVCIYISYCLKKSLLVLSVCLALSLEGSEKHSDHFL